jgi:hypothetical protein
MVIELRCVSLNLIAFIFKSCGCVPSKGIGVVEREISNVERVGYSTKLMVSSS